MLNIFAKFSKFFMFTFLIMLKVWRGVKVHRQNPLQKNTNLITFDRFMGMPSNYTPYVKRHLLTKSILYYDDAPKIRKILCQFWRAILASIFIYISKIFYISFRISKQNWNILFRSKEIPILNKNIFLPIFTFLLTSAW